MQEEQEVIPLRCIQTEESAMKELSALFGAEAPPGPTAHPVVPPGPTAPKPRSSSRTTPRPRTRRTSPTVTPAPAANPGPSPAVNPAPSPIVDPDPGPPGL
jgi:hypothetical protein